MKKAMNQGPHEQRRNSKKDEMNVRPSKEDSATNHRGRRQIADIIKEERVKAEQIYVSCEKRIDDAQHEALKAALYSIHEHQKHVDTVGDTKLRVRMMFKDEDELSPPLKFSFRMQQQDGGMLQVNRFVKAIKTCEADVLDVLRVLSDMLATRQLVNCYIRVKYTERKDEEELFSSVGKKLADLAKRFCVVAGGVEDVKECILRA